MTDRSLQWSPAPGRWLRAAAWSATLVLATGCSLESKDCREVLPIPAEAAIVSTPAGRPGCGCVVDGVSVVADAQRDGLLGWKRGQLWIEGRPVAESEFAARLEEEKTRKRVEEATRQAKEAAASAMSRASGAVRGFLDGLRKP